MNIWNECVGKLMSITPWAGVRCMLALNIIGALGLQRLKCIYICLSFFCFQVRMPLYQTKTIANILEPVAQQVPNLHLRQIQRRNVSIFRSASWSSFTRRARMATPCPTWRPPWWLWARPWATLSGLWELWELRIIIHSFFNKWQQNVKVTVMSCQDVVRRHIHDILV